MVLVVMVLGGKTGLLGLEPNTQGIKVLPRAFTRSDFDYTASQTQKKRQPEDFTLGLPSSSAIFYGVFLYPACATVCVYPFGASAPPCSRERSPS